MDAAAVLISMDPLIAAAWLVGLIAKDRWPLTRFGFYVPPVIVVGLGCAWLLCGRGRGSQFLRSFVCVATLAAALKIAGVDARWHMPPAPDPSEVCFVHWNVARGALGAERIVATLAQDRADVCLLSESPPLSWVRAQVEHLLPGGHCLADGDLAIVSRFPFVPIDRIAAPGVRGFAVRLALPGGRLDLLAVDFGSYPWRNRTPMVECIARWVRAHDGSIPLIVAGDFNTPRDSISFAPLRERLNHAYEVAGHGWPYSWPLPLPVYAIDHIWCSPGVQVRDYCLRAASCSDHARQVMRIVPRVSTDSKR